MNKVKNQAPGARFLFVAASFVVVVAGLKFAAELLLPFVLASFLAIISLPLLSWLQRRGLPKPVAVFATILADIAVLAGVVALAGGSLTAFTEQAPKYQARLGAMIGSFEAWLVAHGLASEQMALRELLDGTNLMDMVTPALRAVADIISKAVLVVLTMIFIFFEATGFGDKLGLAFGLQGGKERIDRVLREIQHYLAIKTLISLVTGVVVWLWVLLLGVDFPVLWGVVAFLFNYIPSLGSILAAIPAVLMALVEEGPATALLVGVGYLVVNFVLGNLIEPNLMGRRFGLSTLVVFMSLVFWGWVWGPLGMLLSVPLTMILKITLENTRDFRWLAIMLGKNPTGPADLIPGAPRGAVAADAEPAGAASAPRVGATEGRAPSEA